MARILYPLSVDLSGKPVLVVGAGAVAARKLGELIRCGADLTVVAPESNAGVERYLAGLKFLQRPFQAGDELGYYLVFACTNHPEVNALIANLCRKANILCNRADDSEAASFHVPGVLRQGSVTVTVSTGGAAPGLTRLLKRSLSQFIGVEVALLADLIGEFRQALRSGPKASEAAVILERLPYRNLLENIKNLGTPAIKAYLQKLLLADEQDMHSLTTATAFPALSPTLADSVIPIHPVFLVGAGPGHPGLLTQLAAETLRKAEVILHDRLIPEEILHLAPPDCQLIPAGKRGHFESARQEEIETQMVRAALEGKRVVRLKGGDPFIFGRGWEEVLALEAHGIPWSVIPGVSSTTAAPAWAGIPLTHRGVARSYAVMSGMAYSQTNTEIPHADTIVLVMGLQRLAEIVPAFISQGWEANTPVAAIQNATMPDQRVCRSTLSRIGEETARLGFDSPTLLVIGKVVGLSQR